MYEAGADAIAARRDEIRRLVAVPTTLAAVSAWLTTIADRFDVEAKIERAREEREAVEGRSGARDAAAERAARAWAIQDLVQSGELKALAGTMTVEEFDGLLPFMNLSAGDTERIRAVLRSSVS